MKIGILTYHRSHNYGALLQAVALRTIIQRMGHDVSYIDYWPEYHQRIYALPHFSYKELFKNPRNAIFSYRKIQTMKKRKDNYDSFILQHIHPFCSSMEEEYDIVIYGSDQIWRKQPYINKYNPVYFGDNIIKASKHISYAASTNNLPETDSDKEELKHLLTNLDSISVRESNFRDYLYSRGVSNVSLTIDPTLLLSREEWETIIPVFNHSGSRYILLYDLIPGSFDYAEIHRFAQKRQCIVKTIVGKASFTKDNNIDMSCDPSGFVNYIANADFVFTSSYHGLLFALIFHKPFFASFIANKHRADSILKYIGYPERILDPKTKIDESQYPVIDYHRIDKRIDDLKAKSLDFLNHNCFSF